MYARPKAQHALTSNLEGEWATTVSGRVKFLDGIEPIQPARVVSLNSHARVGDFAGPFLRDFVF